MSAGRKAILVEGRAVLKAVAPRDQLLFRIRSLSPKPRLDRAAYIKRNNERLRYRRASNPFRRGLFDFVLQPRRSTTAAFPCASASTSTAALASPSPTQTCRACPSATEGSPAAARYAKAITLSDAETSFSGTERKHEWIGRMVFANDRSDHVSTTNARICLV